MRAMAALFLVLTSTQFAGLALADPVYSWRDKQGVMHYSDRPPPGDARQGQTLEAPAAPPAAAAARRDLANQEMEFRKRREAEAKNLAEAEKARTEAAESRENCTQARNQLAALESGERITRINASGEREYLSDAERGGEIERARKAVASWCK